MYVSLEDKKKELKTKGIKNIMIKNYKVQKSYFLHVFDKKIVNFLYGMNAPKDSITFTNISKTYGEKPCGIVLRDMIKILNKYLLEEQYYILIDYEGEGYVYTDIGSNRSAQRIKIKINLEGWS